MIVVEHLIREAIATIEEIQLNAGVSRKPSFGWGDKKELNRYLELKKDNAYPLIWLIQNKEKHIEKGTAIEKDCTFIIATRETRTDLFNDERYLNSFNVVLNPLTEMLLKVLKRSQSISSEYEIFKRPNYSENKKENGTIDLWDAIELNIDITFRDC